MAESRRRAKHDEQRSKRVTLMMSDQKSTAQQLEKINAAWDTAVSHTETDILRESLEAQKQACNALVTQKDALISDCHRELKMKDDEFVKELRSQAHDVQTVLDTMSGQTRSIWSNYQEQLDEIENVFVQEREGLLKKRRELWEATMAQRREEDNQQAAAALAGITDREAQEEQMRLTDSEVYNMVKIKLETDVQTLEQQLQQMRATYQLNSEKLEYNFQVLKKRDEENQVTITQQKRKITRLQDIFNNLRIKITKQEKQYQDENAALTEDYRRITDQFKDLQKKFRHFQASDRACFDEVWSMNEIEATGLLEDVLKGDRNVFQQQLGLEWSAPDISHLGPRNISSSNGAHDVARSATDALREIYQDESNDLLTGDEEHPQEPSLEPGDSDETEGGDTLMIKHRTIKDALDLIASESGFLVEAKLDRLLGPLPPKQSLMMKLDSIFKALGIKTEADIRFLASYCVDRSKEGDDMVEDMEPTLIHPNSVPEALRAFVEDFRQAKGLDTQQDSARLGDETRGFKYWEDIPNAHSAERARVWDALSDALQKYSEVLLDRSKALDRTDELQRENGELKQLLQHYMSSEVNNELVIPPTKVLAQQVRQGARAASSQ